MVVMAAKILRKTQNVTNDSGVGVGTQRMPIVSEVVIGSKKILSSAQTARMKLLKNDNGTRTNGVWTLSYLFSRWLRTLLAQRSIGFPLLRCGLRFAPNPLRPRAAQQRSRMANKSVPV